MVELDVRDDGDVDVQREHRAVRLVGLDHEPLPRAPVGVEAGRRQRPADEVGGLEAAAQQHVRRHRRRRGLAVRPGDRDRALERAQLREQLGARMVGQAALARRGALGVVERDRGRVHDLDAVAGGHVGGAVADVDLDAEGGQRLQAWRSRRDRSPRPRRRAASPRARSRSSPPRRGRSGAAAVRPRVARPPSQANANGAPGATRRVSSAACIGIDLERPLELAVRAPRRSAAGGGFRAGTGGPVVFAKTPQ